MTKKLGNRRVSGTEQYYTPKDLADELVKLTLKAIPRATERTFLEPAGGTGSFIEALNMAGITAVTSVDKYPMHPGVIKADFLEWETKDTDLLTISNPPFGRNNALSVPFFNRAAKFSSHIAFLVPRSWRKWSVQNRLDTRFHLVLDVDVAVQYEDVLGAKIAKRNDLRTCFQIWEKRLELRPVIAVPDNGFIQKSSPDEADLAVRVFGYGCGTVMDDFPRQPNTTLMFLRVLDKSIESALQDLDYERFSINTAYTRALSFQEINFLINEQVFGDGFHKKLGL
ncbi:MAG: putative RNA methylase [Aquiluna sp.]|jgi:predicted RNA methylase|tara:strand:- start:1663 stop:2511 length:849 start_codon:yes stop_codon:yes gene_type:complete